MALTRLVFITILLCRSLSLGVVVSGQKTWCVAKPSTSEADLRNNINYACQIINCGTIQAGGPCYEPPQLANQASVVMNLFYQQNGRKDFTCYFSNSAIQAMEAATMFTIDIFSYFAFNL